MVSLEPWEDWAPGVLTKRQMKLLIDSGHLHADESSLGVSSLDLTLSSEIYQLPHGTIKPTGGLYRKNIEDFGTLLPPIGEEGMVLTPRENYVVLLKERLYRLRTSNIFGQATAKSTTGRIDVLARLVVDGMDCYESFTPEHSGGDLYLEITSLTFPVRIRPGISLSQLRLVYGDPEVCRLRGGINATFLRGEKVKGDASLSVDLEPETQCGRQVVAFRAKQADHLDPLVLWKKDAEPWKYWDFVSPSKVTRRSSTRLSLEKGLFYILKSKELIALPKGVAVYCRAIDESIGEMRIHYAGFAHPFFGRSRNDGTIGTPLIFEVRGHDVNVSLQDGETMARLQFYRMSEDANPKDADPEGPYEDQTLKLSKFFQPWPTSADVDDTGAVTPQG
jgi:dCTP deaminase